MFVLPVRVTYLVKKTEQRERTTRIHLVRVSEVQKEGGGSSLKHRWYWDFLSKIRVRIFRRLRALEDI